MNSNSDNSQDNDALTRVTHYVDREGRIQAYPMPSKGVIEDAEVRDAHITVNYGRIKDGYEVDGNFTIIKLWKRVKSWLTGQ